MATLAPEQIAAIQERRQAALLEKYINGKATPAEVIEIAPLIAQIQAPVGSAPTGFALAAEPEIKRRTGYVHELAFYAERYKSDPRSVKRWVADGRAATPPDPCPLDSPTEMPVWWQRCKKQRAPEKILAAAIEKPKASAPAQNSGPPPAAMPVLPQPRDWSEVAGESLAEQVTLFRRTVSINGRLLNEALTANPPDEAVITSRQRTYERSLEQLRKLEKTDQETRVGNGELIRKADVIADLATLLNSLATMRRAMAERIVEMLPWLSGAQRGEVAAAVDTVRKREDELLRSSEKWSPASLPDLLAA